MRRASVRIATWNILGRRVAKTKMPADDGSVHTIIARHPVDILCLQEVHFHNGTPDVQLVRELASAGLTHFTWLSLSESHLDSSASLGVGIASRYPLSGRQEHVLSNPGLRAIVRGEHWVLHDKGMVGGVIQIPRFRPLRVCSLHLFPFHEFGVGEDDDRVDKMWAEFWKYADAPDDAELVLAGDFNQERKESAAKRWGTRPWSFCLGHPVTTSFGLALDEIATSWSPPSARSWSVPTFSDHHLAIAEVDLSPLRIS
ncbi:MAG: endonuclease/exonuclease/phosphatase family protein [Dactylosporangium sp.]|nr:endonuclease/exonuclease/phosphatase family protein [Dactylosporangium sp.]NNJ60030.1 endonuclease/exonuclease/phosphatase family protein [Dactylosporangium sp.]